MQNCLTLRIIFKSKKGNMWFHKSCEFLQLFCKHHSHRPHHTPTRESDSVRQWTVRASLVQVFKFNFPTTAGVTDPPFCKCQLKKCIDSMFYLQVLIRFVQIRRFVFHSAKICCWHFIVSSHAFGESLLPWTRELHLIHVLNSKWVFVSAFYQIRLNANFYNYPHTDIVLIICVFDSCKHVCFKSKTFDAGIVHLSY